MKNSSLNCCKIMRDVTSPRYFANLLLFFLCLTDTLLALVLWLMESEGPVWFHRDYISIGQEKSILWCCDTPNDSIVDICTVARFKVFAVHVLKTFIVCIIIEKNRINAEMLFGNDCIVKTHITGSG